MKKPIKNGKSEKKIRDEAEEKLANTPEAAVKIQAMPHEELIHELQVHQIELEMQNEELKRVQLTLEESRDKYLDLYDFAPVGYFTITHEGRIAEVNLAGAKLMGVERKRLIDMEFKHFIQPENLFIWEQHHLSVLQSEDKQECYLMLRREDSGSLYVRMESIRLEYRLGRPLIRTVVSDISERKRAEDALEVRLDEESRLNNLLLQREFRIDELKNENASLKERIMKLELRLGTVKE